MRSPGRTPEGPRVVHAKRSGTVDRFGDGRAGARQARWLRRKECSGWSGVEPPGRPHDEAANPVSEQQPAALPSPYWRCPATIRTARQPPTQHHENTLHQAVPKPPQTPIVISVPSPLASHRPLRARQEKQDRATARGLARPVERAFRTPARLDRTLTGRWPLSHTPEAMGTHRSPTCAHPLAICAQNRSKPPSTVAPTQYTSYFFR